MKVLLRRNVLKLGKIGEVVDVTPGYARNYLLPQALAVQPTAGNVKAVEAEKQQYLEELAKNREELKARAALMEGKEITISARANEEGHLYGSVGPAQIVAAMEEAGFSIQAREVELGQPIRTLDRHEVAIRFDEDIAAKITIVVTPLLEAVSEVEEASDKAGAAE